MFSKLKRSKTRASGSKPAGSPGKRAYAIGDIHGRLDLLDKLLARIDEHRADRADKDTHIVFLGDLIDRGPDSKGVIERALALSRTPVNFHFVMGNHEESLTRALSGEPRLISPWLQHGGYDTVESYGVERGALMGQEQDANEHLLMSAIPQKHIDFLATFLDSIQFGDFLFVHAGIKPGVPISQQSSKDMRWIRQEFLESEANHGSVIVHGHTVNEAIQHFPNRIGLDTGAYKTGRLSAIWIDGSELGFLQVSEEQ